MKQYWKKFFNLTVLENNVTSVNKVLREFGDKVVSSDYHIYDVDGEKIAHYSLVLDGKKTFQKIISQLNSK